LEQLPKGELCRDEGLKTRHFGRILGFGIKLAPKLSDCLGDRRCDRAGGELLLRANKKVPLFSRIGGVLNPNVT
jgi:hypothetical protein